MGRDRGKLNRHSVDFELPNDWFSQHLNVIHGFAAALEPLPQVAFRAGDEIMVPRNDEHSLAGEFFQ
ncbi:MAG UNVERIFIED_CONTAM: hypothetical protein LVR18_00670 [Planctomycetaceae bacterium]